MNNNPSNAFIGSSSFLTLIITSNLFPCCCPFACFTSACQVLLRSYVFCPLLCWYRFPSSLITKLHDFSIIDVYSFFHHTYVCALLTYQLACTVLLCILLAVCCHPFFFPLSAVRFRLLNRSMSVCSLLDFRDFAMFCVVFRPRSPTSSLICCVTNISTLLSLSWLPRFSGLLLVVFVPFFSFLISASCRDWSSTSSFVHVFAYYCLLSFLF